jgi:hypothetical protein
MALRAFDDVKESVRASAAGLLRSLRGISLRLMDRSQTPATGGGVRGGHLGVESWCHRGGGATRKEPRPWRRGLGGGGAVKVCCVHSGASAYCHGQEPDTCNRCDRRGLEFVVTARKTLSFVVGTGKLLV